MDQHEKDTLNMFNKINENSNNVVKKYEEAYQRSESSQRIRYGKTKKKKNKVNLKIAIAAIVLTATMTTGLTNLATTSYINNNNVVISTEDSKTSVDEKILEYESLMNKNASQDSAIVTSYGPKIGGNYEEQVDYTSDNIKNLVNHLTNAAEISESETRCAVIAAYRIINEPYRDSVLGKAFKAASTQQTENSNYTIPSTTQEFLEKLGYESWEEYQLNERENIKDLKAAEEYVGGKNR